MSLSRSCCVTWAASCFAACACCCAICACCTSMRACMSCTCSCATAASRCAAAWLSCAISDVISLFAEMRRSSCMDSPGVEAPWVAMSLFARMHACEHDGRASLMREWPCYHTGAARAWASRHTSFRRDSIRDCIAGSLVSTAASKACSDRVKPLGRLACG